jgi:hypothetical protein
MAATYPEHSPLGASSAERWLNCSGSVWLIRALANAEHALAEAEEPGFRLFGSEGHALAEVCLKADIDSYEADPKPYTMWDVDMMRSVQTHLNYVRSLPGWKFTELRMHRPEFHDLAYGTCDVACLDPGSLEIVDLKLGAGVVVEVEENPQLMYYAFLVIDELGDAWDDDESLKITVVQPRIKWHADGVIRSWVTTVGFIRRWAATTLRPGMEAVYQDAVFDMGAHCRFCPAKLLCPPMLLLANEFGDLRVDQIQSLTDVQLARALGKVSNLKMIIPELMKEGRRRLIANRGQLDGWKVVGGLKDRAWKPDAPVFGYQAAKPLSPAQVEDMPGGPEFVAQWATRDFAGYDIVPEKDRRKAIDIADKKWPTFAEHLK